MQKTMINQNYNKLLLLKLDTMANLYLEQSNKKEYIELPFDERFAILIDKQLEDNKNKELVLLKQKATLRISNANVCDIDYLPERKIDKTLTLSLSECDYIKSKLNVIVIGATGAGKTFYACALANSAINKGIRTKYIRMPDLLYEINAFRETPKSYKRKVKFYSNFDLLVIDDWLITTLNKTEQADILELLEQRNGNKSTIFASQFEPAGWIERLGANAVADAIMDRIIHDSYIVTIEGNKSMREIKSQLK